jgi:hypothetical protein
MLVEEEGYILLVLFGILGLIKILVEEGYVLLVLEIILVEEGYVLFVLEIILGGLFDILGITELKG